MRVTVSSATTWMRCGACTMRIWVQVVGITMPKIDPPKLKGLTLDWEGWISNHFECKDESGTAVFFRKIGFSKSIPSQVAGIEEFFILGYVKPGAKYVFEYIPILSEPKRYRYVFTAPTGAKEGERVAFMEVE